MRLLALLLLAICCSAFAEDDTDNLIKQLGDNEFDLREKATAKLSQYPEEYIEKFLNLAKDSTDPEIAYRLHLAAESVFIQKVLPKTDDWRKLYGSLGLEIFYATVYNKRYSAETPGEPGHMYYEYDRAVLGVSCVDPDSSCKGKINDFDVIVAIDELNLLDFYNGCYAVTPNTVIADKEYTVTLRRYKDTSSIHDNRQIPGNEVESEALTVKVKAGWKDEQFVDQNKKEEIIKRHWRNYLIKRGEIKVEEKPQASVETKTDYFKDLYNKVAQGIATAFKNMYAKD